MTFEEIVKREEANMDSIVLYHEGMFLKAYEHSCFRVYMLVPTFKLSKRYIKSAKAEVISLGFPATSLGRWLKGLKFEKREDGTEACVIGNTIDVEEYRRWKETVEVNNPDNYTPHTSAMENTPVYKVAYDLLTQVMNLSANFSKNTASPFGTALKQRTYQMCYLIRRMYDVPDRDGQIAKAMEAVEEIKYLLQILCDWRQMSVAAFAEASERIVSVSKQLDGLRRKAKA